MVEDRAKFTQMKDGDASESSNTVAEASAETGASLTGVTVTVTVDVL